MSANISPEFIAGQFFTPYLFSFQTNDDSVSWFEISKNIWNYDKKLWSDKNWPVQGSSSQKYSQMSKKIEVKATKKKGRMLVAKEQIEPGKHFFMGFPIHIGLQHFIKSNFS